MYELEIESLINQEKYSEALDLLLKVYHNRDYINKEHLLSNIAFCYIRLNHYPEAEEFLKMIIDMNSADDETYYNLGLVYFSQEKYEDALIAFENIARNDTISREITYYEVISLIKLNRIDEANLKVRDFLKENISPDVIYQIGINMVSQGFASHARDVFLSYLEKAQNDIDATFGLGIAYVEISEYRKAIECFKRVHEWAPDRYPSAVIMLGMCFYKIGRPESAVKYLKDAIEADSNSMEAWYYLGVVYESTEQIKQAIDAYQNALRITPDSGEIWERLGYIYLKRDELQLALGHFNKAYQYTDKNIYAYKIGLILMMQERFEEAIDYFTLCLDDSEPEEIYENLGTCYFRIRKYDEAISYLKHAIQMKHNSHKDLLFFMIGNSYMKTSQPEQAREYLLEGLKINPKEVNILYTLGILEANLENYELAEHYLEKASIIERNADILYALSLTKLKLNDVIAAVDLLEEYRLINRDDIQSLYKLGLLYTQLKRYDQAKATFNDILTLNPEHKNAQKYLDELRKL